MKKNTIISLLIITLTLCFSVVFWRNYLTYDCIKKSDLILLNCKLKSAEPKSSYKSSYFEIFIIENSIRYRVSIEFYKRFFNQIDFFRNVKRGDEISIFVKKSQYDNPEHPMFDRYDTVFIYGLRDRKMTYLNPENALNWNKHNRNGALFLAIFFSLLTLAMIIDIIVRTIKNRKELRT